MFDIHSSVLQMFYPVLANYTSPSGMGKCSHKSQPELIFKFLLDFHILDEKPWLQEDGGLGGRGKKSAQWLSG